MDIDDDDLYGDLVADEGGGKSELLLASEVAELRAQLAAQDREMVMLRQRLEDTEKERDELAERQAVLTRNISCLFKTAKAEIERKDELIKELRASQGPAAAARRPPPPPQQQQRQLHALHRATPPIERRAHSSSSALLGSQPLPSSRGTASATTAIASAAIATAGADATPLDQEPRRPQSAGTGNGEGTERMQRDDSGGRDGAARHGGGGSGRGPGGSGRGGDYGRRGDDDEAARGIQDGARHRHVSRDDSGRQTYPGGGAREDDRGRSGGSGSRYSGRQHRRDGSGGSRDGDAPSRHRAGGRGDDSPPRCRSASADGGGGSGRGRGEAGVGARGGARIEEGLEGGYPRGGKLVGSDADNARPLAKGSGGGAYREPLRHNSNHQRHP